ncbi:hypothetical protein ACFL54_08515, partial [Planctomycetota bacterium]
LHPDGGLSDAGRTLAYPLANIGRTFGMSGTLEFWVKPNYDPAITTRVRSFFTVMPPDYSSSTRYSADGLWYFPHGGTKEELNCNWDHPSTDGLSCATKSITFGWWNWIMEPTPFSCLQYGRSGETANHSWPGHEEAVNHGVHSGQYNYEMHEWTHLLISWDRWGYYGLSSPDLMAAVIINNQPSSNDRAWHHGSGAWSPIFPIKKIHDYWRSPTLLYKEFLEGFSVPSPPNYIRFGEYASKMEHIFLEPGSSRFPLPPKVFRNWACDATLADIISYPDGPYDHNQFTAGNLVPTNYPDNYTYGRYLSAIDSDNTAGKYTSWPVNLGKEFPLLSNNIALIPRSVSWTLYKPKNNRNPEDANDRSVDTMTGVSAPDLDGDGEGDLICVDISIDKNDSYGNEWYYQEKQKMATHAVGWDFKCNNPHNKLFRYERGDIFRYNIHFNLDEGHTLYQSPVLDDITFTFSLSRPRILLWQILK